MVLVPLMCAPPCEHPDKLGHTRKPFALRYRRANSRSHYVRSCFDKRSAPCAEPVEASAQTDVMRTSEKPRGNSCACLLANRALGDRAEHLVEATHLECALAYQ